MALPDRTNRPHPRAPMPFDVAAAPGQDCNPHKLFQGDMDGWAFSKPAPPLGAHIVSAETTQPLVQPRCRLKTAAAQGSPEPVWAVA